MFLVVASVLLCVGLFGCDRQPQAPVAAPIVAVAPPCNCAPPALPPAPVAQAVHRPRHHHHAWSEHESSSYSESGESYSASNETGEYSQSSSVSVTQSDAASAQAAAWVDGYGRSHYATGEQTDENPALLSREDRHTRREVWRGWNSHCDERDE